MTDLAISLTPNQRASVRTEAATLDLADLPKDSLVDMSRRVFGRVGDSARTSKADYLAKLTAADAEKRIDAIVAMVEEGLLEFGLFDEDEPEPDAEPAPRARKAAPAIDSGDAAQKLREAFAALGLGAATEAAPLDEARVSELALEAIGPQLRDFGRGLSDRIDARLADLKMPERVIVLTPKGERKEVTGHVHGEFDRVLAHAGIRDNVLLVGPSGCGKTQLAHQVADALELPFSFLSCTAGMSESQLLGWLLPVGIAGQFEYVRSAFVKAYEEGGVFLLDELDAADENVLLVINSALANGHLSIPQRHANPIATRHADFVMIAAANTYGHGADRVYAGRNQLDGATLDRFRTAIVQMDYDATLEASLCDPAVLAWGAQIRSAIMTNKLRRVMSTRALIGFTRQKDALKWGKTEWERSYFADWTKDELSKAGR